MHPIAPYRERPRGRRGPGPSAALRIALAALGLAMAPGLGPWKATARAQLGLESFAKPPETPLELWGAVDYLVRIGRADIEEP